jgi:hypothetical protein
MPETNCNGGLNEPELVAKAMQNMVFHERVMATEPTTVEDAVSAYLAQMVRDAKGAGTVTAHRLGKVRYTNGYPEGKGLPRQTRGGQERRRYSSLMAQTARDMEGASRRRQGPLPPPHGPDTPNRNRARHRRGRLLGHRVSRPWESSEPERRRVRAERSPLPPCRTKRPQKRNKKSRRWKT